MRKLDGAQIRRLREAHLWTQYELGRCAGVSERQIKRLEANRVPNPQAKTIAAIAGALQVAPESLFINLRSCHQIPQAPLDFFGREREIRLLDELRREGRQALGIQGLAGIGKTALAQKLSDLWTEQFPDGQLYFDLRGHADTHCAQHAMLHVLQSLQPDRMGIQNESEIDEGHRIPEAYRSLLFDHRVLLVMDNVQSVDQVENLIPPSGSLLVFICQRRLVVPGVHAVDLPPLSDAEARRLILGLAPHARAAAGRIATLCAGHPLALKLAGSRLAERPDVDPRQLAAELEEGSNRLRELDRARSSGGVEECFDLSYARLEPALRAKLCRLVVFAQDFDRAAIQAVWNAPFEETEEAIGRLLSLHLLEFNGVPGAAARYRLHDLVKIFLDARLEHGARDEAEARHAEHFFGVLQRADEAYLRGAQEDAIETLAREWKSFHHAFESCRGRTETDLLATRLCARFPLAYVLRMRQSPREQVEWSIAALGAARRLGDRSAEAELLTLLCDAYTLLGESTRAISCAEAALEMARTRGERAVEGRALLALGYNYSRMRQADAAIDCCQRALEIAQSTRDVWMEGRAHSALGHAYIAMDEYHLGIEFGDRGLQVARAVGDRWTEGRSLANAAWARTIMGEPHQAIDLYQETLAISRAIGDRWTQAETLCSLTVPYVLLCDYPHVRRHAERGIRLAREIGDPRTEARALVVLGSVLTAEGKAAQAVSVCEQGLAIARKMDGSPIELWGLLHLAVAHAARGRRDLAFDYGQQAQNLTCQLGEPWSQGRIFSVLANLYTRVDEPEQAVLFARKALAVQCRTRDELSRAFTLAYMGLGYAQLGRAREAIRCCERSRSIAQRFRNRWIEAMTLIASGTAELIRAQPARAEPLLRQGHELMGEVGDRWTGSWASGQLSRALEACGRTLEAIEAMRSWVEYQRSVAHQETEASAARLADLERRLGSRDRVAASAERARA